jgi:putative membrane protein
MKEEIDPQVIFSAERSLLSWIRTGLAMMGLGFVVARFHLLITGENAEMPFSIWIGSLLVFLGVGVNISASLKYSKRLKQIRENKFLDEGKWSFGRLIAVILALIGFIMAIYLLTF